MKTHIESNSYQLLLNYINTQFSVVFENIHSISLHKIDQELDKQKAKENEIRKKRFDKKTQSEQNLHNIRRQHNLGNIELQNELSTMISQEENNEINNPLPVSDNNIGENDDYLFIEGNLQNVPSEDNNDEIDLY